MTPHEGHITDCVVLVGEELVPWTCSRFSWKDGKVDTLDVCDPVTTLDRGAVVVMPSMCNAHTHMGDSCLPDGATGLTLEQAFFRPNGYKYKELQKRGDGILDAVERHLSYMAGSGSSLHIDFREMGTSGAKILRRASQKTGVDSVILSQFATVPFESSSLDRNTESLPDSHVEELNAILEISDGFSESTMNDLTDPAWSQIREITDAAGKFRAIHCLESEGYRTESLRITGRGDLERAIELYDPHLIVHLTVSDEAEIALMASSGKTGVLNPRANANLGLPIPPIAALLKAGVPLLLGTDNGMLNSPNLFAELDFTYKLAKSQFANVVDPHPVEILKMVTSNAGAVLGSRFPGNLEVGLPANFTVLDFQQPHLMESKNIHASIVTRVTPGDVLKTVHAGASLFESERCAL